jgi:uncharacterized coiled-coil protein SlyX
MKKTAIIVILSLVAGFALGAWSSASSRTDARESGQGTSTTGFDPGAAPDDRLAALERAIAEERDARRVLEDQLQELFTELERIDSPQLRMLLQQFAVAEQRQAEPVSQGSIRRSQRRSTSRNFAEMRRQQLIDGGFSEARASEIRRLEDEARMDMLMAEYEARQAGEATNPWEQAYSYQSTLRDKLGDAEFEKYLQAQGNATVVTVREVIDSSPANRAGLRPGDEIVSYDGDRVFGMNDLRSMSFSGNRGEDVVVEVIRDGQRMQLVLPRGPMGITGSGASMGFRGSFGG